MTTLIEFIRLHHSAQSGTRVGVVVRWWLQVGHTVGPRWCVGSRWARSVVSVIPGRQYGRGVEVGDDQVPTWPHS